MNKDNKVQPKGRRKRTRRKPSAEVVPDLECPVIRPATDTKPSGPCNAEVVKSSSSHPGSWPQMTSHGATLAAAIKLMEAAVYQLETSIVDRKRTIEECLRTGDEGVAKVSTQRRKLSYRKQKLRELNRSLHSLRSQFERWEAGKAWWADREAESAPKPTEGVMAQLPVAALPADARAGQSVVRRRPGTFGRADGGSGG